MSDKSKRVFDDLRAEVKYWRRAAETALAWPIDTPRCNCGATYETAPEGRLWQITDRWRTTYYCDKHLPPDALPR